MSWENFDDWKIDETSSENLSLKSPVFHAQKPFNQLVLSWNVEEKMAVFSFFVRIREGENWSDFYNLGDWKWGRKSKSRTSINHQNDHFAKVLTDILMIKKITQSFQIKVSIRGDKGLFSKLQLISVSLIDTNVKQKKWLSNRKVWGRELAVPRLCQMDYEGGKVWCSPACVGMVLDYWAGKLRRSDLSFRLPELADHVFDPAWEGTGNWSFNMAFAGSLKGIRACVIRLDGMSDLERLIDASIPIPVSVSYGVLKGKGRKSGDGHLIVCVGFTASGDVIVNDPARKPEVRFVYDRGDFARAWRHSHNTSYLIYPQLISPFKDVNSKMNLKMNSILEK